MQSESELLHGKDNQGGPKTNHLGYDRFLVQHAGRLHGTLRAGH